MTCYSIGLHGLWDIVVGLGMSRVVLPCLLVIAVGQLTDTLMTVGILCSPFVSFSADGVVDATRSVNLYLVTRVARLAQT